MPETIPLHLLLHSLALSILETVHIYVNALIEVTTKVSSGYADKKKKKESEHYEGGKVAMVSKKIPKFCAKKATNEVTMLEDDVK